VTNELYVPPKKEKKNIVNVPIVLKQNSNFVAFTINLDKDVDGDSDNGSFIISNFVTSSSFVPSTTLNVVSNTTQSFVPLPFSALPLPIQLTFPSSAYIPSTSSAHSYQLPMTLEEVQQAYIKL
jgi:hypothetical protein